MVLGFTKTQEGVDAYAKIGRPYPDEIMDELYEKWLGKDTTADNLSEHTNHREKEVSKIVRLRTGEGNKEYLVYSFLHYRLDEALNVVSMWRPNIGMYPIPIPRWQVAFGPFGKQERKIAEIHNNETGYSIPFSKESLEDIRTKVGFADKCQFLVQVPSGVKIAVESFVDLRDCDFDALVHFGRTPTDYQREKWIKENGLDKDKHLLDEAMRYRIEGGGPNLPRTFTEEQVRNMIREEREAATAAEAAASQQQTEEQQIKSKPRRTKSSKSSNK